MCSSGGGGGRATPLPLSVSSAAPLPVPLPLLPPLPPLPLPPGLCLPAGAGPPSGGHLQPLGLSVGLPLPPSAPDPNLVDAIVAELKSQGVFDQFRKECIADVDTKPAYQNLRQRVEGSVSGFLNLQNWSPDLNKNQLREKLRKHILDSNFLDQGVERIVDQVVNPKISSVFVPQVEEIFYKYLGLEKPDRTQQVSNQENKSPLQLDTTSDNLLPNDLESVSPESVKSFDTKRIDISNEDVKSPLNANVNQFIKNEDEEKKFENQSEDSLNSNDEEFESPAFEPLESTLKEEGCSKDSHLSGISDLTSHDSNISSNANDAKILVDSINKPEAQNNNSELSQVSSDSNLSDSNARSPSNVKQEIEINFQNTINKIKQTDSPVEYNEDVKESDTKSERNVIKYDDGDNSNSRQCFDESNDYEMLDVKSPLQFNTKTDTVVSENKNIAETFEMAKSTSNIAESQHHRDSIESKTSTESVKGIGSVEVSIDSNESNSVFVHNVKNEPAIEKGKNSFENAIKVSSTEHHNDSSNGSKNESVKNFCNSEAQDSHDKSKDLDIKNKNPESKSKDVKERDRHSSSSSLRDKDRKDDSRHHSRSSHSRHSSGRRDSEKGHSSSRDKKDHNSSKSSNRDKHSKSGSTSDSKKDRHGSSSHKSSHKSSRHSDYKHSSSDKSNSHEFKDHKYRNKDSSSKNDSKSENNKEKTGSSESSSYSKHSEKHSDHTGKYSHHSSHRDKSNSRHSRSEKSTKSNGSNSSDDKKNDEKKNKKPKDENCNTSNKYGRTRRSTDRDSNDGSGGSTKASGTHKGSSSNNYSSAQKSKTSNSDNNSNGNYSGQSDTLKADTVNITSGCYIKSEFNMFEFGSMSAIKRHNLNEKSAQAAKILENTNVGKVVDNDASDKSPDISISSPTQINLFDKINPVKSPEIPNKKPVIHIDSQLKPEKPNEIIFSQEIRCDILKKPKCASNIYEAMKVMKIRKKMDKLEQKRKQEAIMLLEKQHNVPKNSSTIYSGVSGPEVVLTCMKPEEIESYSKIKSPIRSSTSDQDVKYFDNKFDKQLTVKLNHLKQHILKLERQCKEYEASKICLKKEPIDETYSEKKNGFLLKELQVSVDKMDESVYSLSNVKNIDEIKFGQVEPDEVQENLCSDSFNDNYSEQDSSFNNEKYSKYNDGDLVLNKSKKDIFEIILGSEVSFDTTTVSYSGEFLNYLDETVKEKKFNVLTEEFGVKSIRMSRKRPSTSMYDNEKNLENDGKFNYNNNNELLCDKKRRIVKKNPLVEKDLTKHNILNCQSPKIECSEKYKKTKDLPLKLKIEIHKGKNMKDDTPISDDSLTKSSEVLRDK